MYLHTFFDKFKFTRPYIILDIANIKLIKNVLT